MPGPGALVLLLVVVVILLLAVGAVVLLRRGPVGAGPNSDELERERRRTQDAEARSERAESTAARADQAAAHAEAAAAATRAELTTALERERLARTEAREQLDRGRAELAVVQAEQQSARERAMAAARAAALEQARDEAVHELSAERSELRGREQRLVDREQRVDDQVVRLELRAAEVDELTAALRDRATALDEEQTRLGAERERAAGLTAEQARTELVETIRTDAKREAAVLVRDIEAEARQSGERRARQIVVEAIQRVASDQTSESVVSVLHLPAEEMKGRIIGREGRNIRTFEQVTGVNVIIDDTPEAVLLSCFDPVRREIGRLTLEKLVLDGRIHPHRIEETYEVSKAEIDQLCERAAEDALVQVGLTDVHPGLRTLLGRLRYRASYGQNVLKHLIETAHIAGIMADELHVDRTVLVRGAFLHDVGKALTHESQGSHAIIGAEVAKKYGESDDVVHAIEAHHNEVAPRTMEAVLTQAADACSGGRPGARRESLEAYVERLHRIEAIAAGKPGVDKVFAMQAGRQVRVMVSPDHVDDLGAQVLARDIAKQIEEELTYPGQIQVTVIRESRATETAR